MNEQCCKMNYTTAIVHCQSEHRKIMQFQIFPGTLRPVYKTVIDVLNFY